MQKRNVIQKPLRVESIRRAIAQGWYLFSRTRSLSVSFSMIFALFGLIVLIAIEQASLAPMLLPIAGGFMLIGPMLLSGFFAIADGVKSGRQPVFTDILAGFSRTSREMVALCLVCTLLFLIWITDAATLYGFMIGREPVAFLSGFVMKGGSVLPFLFWSSLMGAALAGVIFTVSAFSFPLLYYRRAGLVRAVILSVRTVFSNFLPTMLWAAILAGVVIVSILILPFFLVTFPVLAFASHTLYREVFPEEAPLTDDDGGCTQ